MGDGSCTERSKRRNAERVAFKDQPKGTVH